MNMQEKINEELNDIKYTRKNLIKRFEKARNQMIELLQKATPSMICELEERYQVAIDIKRYAREIEICNAKLRVYDYLTDESR